jgi:hypothetical protein
MARESDLRAAATTSRKLVRWLVDHGYVSGESAELALEASAAARNDLPAADRLSSLLYEHAGSFFGPEPPRDGARIIEDYLTIERTEPGALWFEGGLGPVHVPDEPAELAKPGWGLWRRSPVRTGGGGCSSTASSTRRRRGCSRSRRPIVTGWRAGAPSCAACACRRRSTGATRSSARPTARARTPSSSTCVWCARGAPRRRPPVRPTGVAVEPERLRAGPARSGQRARADDRGDDRHGCDHPVPTERRHLGSEPAAEVAHLAAQLTLPCSRRSRVLSSRSTRSFNRASVHSVLGSILPHSAARTRKATVGEKYPARSSPPRGAGRAGPSCVRPGPCRPAAGVIGARSRWLERGPAGSSGDTPPRPPSDAGPR